MRERRAVWSLALGSFLVRAGFGLVGPSLPVYVRVHHLPVPLIGMASAAYMAVSIAGMLLLAPQADRWGHRTFLRLGGLAYLLGAVWLWRVPGAVSLVAARMLAGLATALTQPAATAYVAVMVSPSRRGWAYGMVSSVTMAGFVLGPVVGGAALASLGWVGPVEASVVAAALSLAAFATLPAEPPLSSLAPRAPSHLWAHMAVLAQSPWLMGMAALSAGLGIANGVYDATWSLYLFRIGAPPWLVGLSYSLWAVPLVVLSPWAGRRIPASRAGGWLAAGSALSSLAALAYACLRNPWVVTAIGLGEGIGGAITMPVSQVWVSARVPAQRVATVQGALGAVSQGAALAAAAVGGILFPWSPGLPFVLVAAGTAAGALWLWWAVAQERRSRHPAWRVPTERLDVPTGRP